MEKIIYLAAFVGLLAGNSIAQAGMQATQYGNALVVVLDAEADMNWLEIYEANGAVVVEGAGTTNIFVPVWHDRDRFSASSIQQLYVGGSQESDIIVNQTAIPMLAAGGPASDVIIGGYADDVLYGGDGNDGLFGREGDDDLYGEGDADGLSGGPGKDWIDMGGQVEEQFMHGDEHADVFVRYVKKTRRGYRAIQVTFAELLPSPQELVALVGICIDIDPIFWGEGPHDVSGAEGDAFVKVVLE